VYPGLILLHKSKYAFNRALKLNWEGKSTSSGIYPDNQVFAHSNFCLLIHIFLVIRLCATHLNYASLPPSLPTAPLALMVHFGSIYPHLSTSISAHMLKKHELDNGLLEPHLRVNTLILPALDLHWLLGDRERGEIKCTCDFYTNVIHWYCRHIFWYILSYKQFLWGNPLLRNATEEKGTKRYLCRKFHIGS
jgi:hypothetical protein